MSNAGQIPLAWLEEMWRDDFVGELVPTDRKIMEQRLFPMPLQPHVDTVEMLKMHREWCPVCSGDQAGLCAAQPAIAMFNDWAPAVNPELEHDFLSTAPVIEYKSPDPVDAKLRRRMCAELLARGVARLADPTLLKRVNPQFIAFRLRFAPPAHVLRSVFSTASSALEATRKLAQETIELAVAQASGAPSKVSAAGLMRAIEFRVTERKPRLVTDCTASGLNRCLSPWPFRLLSMAAVFQRIPPGGWMGTADVESGFFMLAHKLWFQAYMGVLQDGVFMCRLRACFGCKVCPAMFSMLTAEVVQTVQRMLDKMELTAQARAAIVVYIDDFIFAASTETACAEIGNTLRQYCKRVGIPLAEKKWQGPAQRVIVLGVVIDTLLSMASLPDDKLFSLLLLVELLLAAKNRGVLAPRELVRKVAGKLSAAAGVIPGGSARLAELHAFASHGSSAPLTDFIERDLSWWSRALSDPARHIRLTPLGPTASSMSLGLSNSDASGDEGGACGIYLGRIVIHAVFVGTTSTSTVPQREYTAPLLFLERFGHFFDGLRLVNRTDSSTIDSVANKGSSSVERLRCLSQYQSELSLDSGCDLFSEWLAREFNPNADDLTHATASDTASPSDRVSVCRRLLEMAGLGKPPQPRGADNPGMVSSSC